MLTCIDRPLCLPFWISGDLARVSFNNCVVVDAVGGTQRKIVLSQLQSVPSFEDTVFYLQSGALPGALHQTVDPEDRKKETDIDRGPGLRWVSGQWPLIPLPNPLTMDGSFTLTPMGDGSVTADVPSGLVVRGDLIVLKEEQPNVLANPDGGMGPVLLGRVTRLTPELDPGVDPTSMAWPKMQTLTLTAVPIGLLKKPAMVKSVHLFVAYFPRVHPPTTGDVDFSTQNRIAASIPFSLGLTLTDAWSPGDRIFGEGIPMGSFVLKVVPPNIIIISQAVLMGVSILNSRLFDAAVHRVGMARL